MDSAKKKRRETALKVVIVILLLIIVLIVIACRKRKLSHRKSLPREADIVIVGGGVAGCVLARRLWEKHPNKRIVILDRGEDRRDDPNVYRIEAALTIAYSPPYSEVIPSDFPGVICSVPNLYGGGSSHNFSLTVKGSDHLLHTQWCRELEMSKKELKEIHRKIDARVDITPLPVTLNIGSRIFRPSASSSQREPKN